MVTQLLFNHISPETAFVVNDYPYGFRLRCKIRYWLEFSPNKGFRFVSQTTNPKRTNEFDGTENKPKKSTYFRFGGAMYLDEQNHVTWTGAHEYMDTHKFVEWAKEFGSAVPEIGRISFKSWLGKKIAYESLKLKGKVTFGNGTVVNSDYAAEQINEWKEFLQTL